MGLPTRGGWRPPTTALEEKNLDPLPHEAACGCQICQYRRTRGRDANPPVATSTGHACRRSAISTITHKLLARPVFSMPSGFQEPAQAISEEFRCQMAAGATPDFKPFFTAFSISVWPGNVFGSCFRWLVAGRFGSGDRRGRCFVCDVFGPPVCRAPAAPGALGAVCVLELAQHKPQEWVQTDRSDFSLLWSLVTGPSRSQPFVRSARCMCRMMNQPRL